MSTKNLQAVYSAIYNPCPGCLVDPDNRIGWMKEVCLKNPSTEEELPGWVTNPSDIYCNYCRRMIGIAISPFNGYKEAKNPGHDIE